MRSLVWLMCLLLAACKTWGQFWSALEFSPASGVVGTLVTVTATNFDLSSASSIVVAGVPALVLQKSGTSALIMVMPGTKTGIVTAFASGQSLDSGAEFTLNSRSAVFNQQGSKLVGAVSTATANQGRSVALSADGNTLISGGNQDNGNIGAAWIFVRSGTSWTEQAKLVGTGYSGSPAQGVGAAISADGNTVVLGGNNDSANAGAAWVFVRSGSSWSQQAKLVGTGAIGAAQMGYSVGLSADGNTTIVGGSNDNGNIGAGWVFARSGTSWAQQAKLVGSANIGASGQGLCVAISADGNTAGVGGLQDNSQAGATWVFVRSNSVWTEQAKLLGTGYAIPTYQGSSLSFSADGNTLAVGGPGDVVNQGGAWVFTRSGGTWTQQTAAKLLGSGATGAGQQGSSIALSADGDLMLLGAFQDNTNVGATWVFTRSAGTWTQQGSKLVGGGSVGTANQGKVVGLSADGLTGVVGGLADNTNLGAAWVFTP